MAKVKIQGHASGTGVLTVTAPNTSTDRTITLPDGTGTLIADDGAGNVMVGTTDTVPSNNGAGGDAGVAISSDGAFRAARSGNVSLDINRMDSDGDIAAFRKNGATVGSIGVTSSDQFYIARTTGSQGIKFKNSATMPCASSGNDADNAQDLGSSSVRWKDLYLSGGLKVGGTDAAHTLDDYEEGTWTPVLADASGNAIAGSQSGFYTKIGRAVHFEFNLNVGSHSGTTGGNEAQVNGLPFAVANTIYSPHTTSCGSMASNVGDCVIFQIFPSTSYGRFYKDNWNTSSHVSVKIQDFGTSGFVRCSGTYYTT